MDNKDTKGINNTVSQYKYPPVCPTLSFIRKDAPYHHPPVLRCLPLAIAIIPILHTTIPPYDCIIPDLITPADAPLSSAVFPLPWHPIPLLQITSNLFYALGIRHAQFHCLLLNLNKNITALFALQSMPNGAVLKRKSEQNSFIYLLVLLVH